MEKGNQGIKEILTRLEAMEQRVLDTLIVGLKKGIEDLRQQEDNEKTPKGSPYRGVSWCSEKNLWRARVYKRGGVHHLGYFQEVEWAVEAVERVRRHLEERELRCKQASQYKGVTMDYGRWRSRVTIDGKVLSLGQYASEETAAQHYDEVVLKQNLHRPLNFPNKREQGMGDREEEYGGKGG